MLFGDRGFVDHPFALHRASRPDHDGSRGAHQHFGNALAEILSADQPATGNGVGVALNIGNNFELRKFAKLGRFWRPAEGSVYVVESWNRDEPGNYKVTCFPTDVRLGRIRLSREGSTLFYLVADGADKEIREVHRAPFGTDDLALVRFVVNNSGSLNWPSGVSYTFPGPQAQVTAFTNWLNNCAAFAPLTLPP